MKIPQEYGIIEHEQYFQGCGIANTKFTYIETGIGNNFIDALDSLAQNGWNTFIIEQEIELKKEHYAYNELNEEQYYYVSIRVK